MKKFCSIWIIWILVWMACQSFFTVGFLHLKLIEYIQCISYRSLFNMWLPKHWYWCDITKSWIRACKALLKLVTEHMNDKIYKCHKVHKIGFLMRSTMNNMRYQFQHPVYRILHTFPVLKHSTTTGKVTLVYFTVAISISFHVHISVKRLRKFSPLNSQKSSKIIW